MLQPCARCETVSTQVIKMDIPVRASIGIYRYIGVPLCSACWTVFVDYCAKWLKLSTKLSLED